MAAVRATGAEPNLDGSGKIDRAGLTLRYAAAIKNEPLLTALFQPREEL